MNSKSQVHQGLPYGTYSQKRRPHLLLLLLASLPTSYMKCLKMTALPLTMDRRKNTHWPPPLNQRIQEHESHSRLQLHNPNDFSHNQSAPAHQSRITGHKTVLTTTRYKTQLDLTEHTAIRTRNPSLNRTDSAPTCSKLCIIPKIACTIKPRPAGIVSQHRKGLEKNDQNRSNISSRILTIDFVQNIRTQ